MLELRYRSPLEGNDDSDDGLDDEDEDDEEFIPNVGLVSRQHKTTRAAGQHGGESDGSDVNALVSLEQNIAKLEQSILSNNHSSAGHVTFAGSNGKDCRRSLRRSSSLSEDNNDTFYQKKKRPFNFPNVKKRYGDQKWPC